MIENFSFCSVEATPYRFDKEKFLAGDKEQQALYKSAKKVNQTMPLSFKQVSDDEIRRNYARFIPSNCMFIDFDDKEEAEIIKKNNNKG